MKSGVTKQEIALVDELILTALKYRPLSSGGEVYRILKSILTEQDQDIRDRLIDLEKRGLVEYESIKNFALKHYVLKKENQ